VRHETRSPGRVLEEWAERFVRDSPTGASSDPLEEGLAALARALSLPGRGRDAAYALLVADALLTRSCEAAARASDPEAELLRALQEVGRSPLPAEAASSGIAEDSG